MVSTDKFGLIYSNPYDEVRDLCHAVKEQDGWLAIPKRILNQAISALGHKTILIPIPGHLGNAESNLDICYAIRNKAPQKDIRVIDALRGQPRESLCEYKQHGEEPNTIDIVFQFNDSSDGIDAEGIALLAKTFDIVLVDNVIDSGRTAEAAQKALELPCKLITLGSTGQSGLPMPKLYYTVVRLENQGIDQEDYEAVKALIDRDGNYEQAIHYMSNWDYGGENLDVAECAYEGFRATPTDPRERGDKKLHEADGYILCRSESSVYDAFYLVREIPRQDPLPEGANARTGKGTPVYFRATPDCGENTGGHYVEIYTYSPNYGFDGDRYDDLCVHPKDCDCKDEKALEDYIRKEVSKITEY